MRIPSSSALASLLALVAAAGLLAALATGSASGQTAPRPARAREALSSDMARFVATLDDDQRDEALYAFEDDERFDLRLAPLGLEGLTIAQMTDAQWGALRDLLGHVLSPSGLEKMDTIRSLEVEVAATEGGLFGWLMGGMRDPKRYFLAVFGPPSPESPWGFRFDGHHFSLNTTAVPGQPISATPFFLGGQPRVVPEGLERAGLRVLEDEEALAVELLNGLTLDERTQAWLPWQEGSAIRRPMSVSDGETFEMPPREGLERASLPATSRARLDALLEVHLGHFAADVAARYRAEVFDAETPVTLQYASAGNAPEAVVESGRALYYRIQAGGLSIEFDDTAEAADHVHIVLRHVDNDFGRDLLRAHLAESHAD